MLQCQCVSAMMSLCPSFTVSPHHCVDVTIGVTVDVTVCVTVSMSLLMSRFQCHCVNDTASMSQCQWQCVSVTVAMSLCHYYCVNVTVSMSLCHYYCVNVTVSLCQYVTVLPCHWVLTFWLACFTDHARNSFRQVALKSRSAVSVAHTTPSCATITTHVTSSQTQTTAN